MRRSMWGLGKKKSNQPMEARSRTAYHEAGHAVTYLEYGLDFDYVSIMPENIDGIGLNGVVRRLSPVREIPKFLQEVDLYVSRVINALYAGSISASLFASELLSSDASKGSDYLKIKDLCEKRDKWKFPLIDGPRGDQYLKEKYLDPTFRTLGFRFNIFLAIDFHNLMKII